MKLTSIASGSSGNCIYVGNECTSLLVDTGISAKRIENALNEMNLTTKEVDGILVTHEHIDHISGLGVIARRYGIPIYTTAGTKKGILRTKSVGKIDESLFREIQPEEDFSIGNFTVNATAIWHDALEPVCYSVRDDKAKASIATDMGDYNEHMVHKLQDADILFIEANHDIKMLEVGPYPYPLKRRILSSKGHLSNERAGQFIRELLNDHIEGIFLGHLSKDNNFEELAYETVRLELQQSASQYSVNELSIVVANRDTLTVPVTVNR